MSRAVGYLRISTEGQADGLGLDVQRESVEQWCQAKGHELVAVHQDVTSGKNGLGDRDGLALALTALATGEAQVLVVPRLDRLARDLVLQEQLLREAWMHGEVASCAEGEGNLKDDPDDPSRALIRQVLGAVSQYERSMIALRLKRGRAAKAARGGYSFGSPHYGTKAVNGELVPVPEEQEVIDIIRVMVGEGLSGQQIADNLNWRGVKPRRGQQWYRSQVNRIIRREGMRGQSSADEAASSRSDEVRL